MVQYLHIHYFKLSTPGRHDQATNDSLLSIPTNSYWMFITNLGVMNMEEAHFVFLKHTSVNEYHT